MRVVYFKNLYAILDLIASYGLTQDWMLPDDLTPRQYEAHLKQVQAHVKARLARVEQTRDLDELIEALREMNQGEQALSESIESELPKKLVDLKEDIQAILTYLQ